MSIDEICWEARSNVAIPMRDGTVLRADVFCPSTEAPVPVMLLRNPYPPMVSRRQLDHVRAVLAGLAVVSQSVRRTGASDGHFDPRRWEVTDGVDTIAWCASQPWSPGRVATAKVFVDAQRASWITLPVVHP